MIVGILLLGQYLYKLALNMTEPVQTLLSVVFFVIPHLEFFDVREMLIFGWPIPLWACGMAALYAFAYTMFFLVLTWLVFRKQSLG